MEYYKTLKILLISVILICCRQKSGRESEMKFYESSKTFDMYRLPLIRPIELLSADEGNSWICRYNFKSLSGRSEIDNIEKVGIFKGFIALYCPLTFNGNSMSETWVLIDVLGNSDVIFNEQIKFESYLKKNDLNQMKLISVDSAYKNFAEKSILLKDQIKAS